MVLTAILFFVMVLVVDGMLIATPWLMPDSECFAITVPHGARAKEPLSGLMWEYTVRMAAISVLCALAWPIGFAVFGIDLGTERGVGMLALVLAFSICVPALASFVLMLHYRCRVQAIKAERGWRVDRARAAAFVGVEDFPRPISLLWNLAYLPVMVGMAAFASANYDRFPDAIPMNMNVNGTITDFVPKSGGALLFPVLFTAYMGLLFFGVHLGIVRSKKPIDPDAPASSALAYGRFARVHSILAVAGGLLLCVLTGVLFYASALGAISTFAASMIEVVVALVGVAVVVFVSVRMGQSGGRIAAAAPEGSMSRNDDAFWKLGTFYCNREDPSVFVPKRFGVGWTVNMGNPRSWAAIAGLVILVVGLSLGLSLMAG
jgi:uncharacterized membrane protein